MVLIFAMSVSSHSLELISGAHRRDGGIAYCVWAPDHAGMKVRVQRSGGGTAVLTLEAADHGYFTGFDPAGRAGDRYWFELPNERRVPDVASRFQPEGVHGPSECIDPNTYAWRAQWTRPAWRDPVIYELHVGTFTPAGTFRSAIDRLAYLRDLGVDVIELMPVADFPGARNWGYDGVAIYAPARCYGRPDDLRALIDAAHEHGLAVMLDVVYNHLGPDGNYLGAYAKDYSHASRSNPWGGSFNFDGRNSGPVRDFFRNNAAYWLDEFRFDGLRLDAIHAIEDDSPRHFLAELAETVHARGGFVIGEDPRNLCELIEPATQGGVGLDAVWADDFHHEVRVATTGTREAYFGSFSGSGADLAATLAKGWFYRGQPYPFWKGKPRGTDCAQRPTSAFVHCIENHDQVGNRAAGERLAHLVSPATFRAASMLLCLSPYVPMLFMGQEWGATTPFQFFTDHVGELGHQVTEGRKREFADAGLNQGVDDVPDPQLPETFMASKLRWEERDQSGHGGTRALYREALRQRKQWLAGATGRDQWSVRAEGEAIAVEYRGPNQPRRCLIVTLKGDDRGSAQRLLSAPAQGRRWGIVLDSEETRFEGERPSIETPDALDDAFTGPRAVLFVEEA